MMTVETKFFASFQEVMGERKKNFSASSVLDLLEEVAEENSEMKDGIFEDFEERELSGFVNVLVNGRRIETLDGLETSLEEGDTVAIFPPVSGG